MKNKKNTNMFFRMTLDYSELAAEIVESIPERRFISETDTFLDPAFAGGQLLKALATRLDKYGHSIENIQGRLFGYEDSITYLNHPKNALTARIASLNIMKYNEIDKMKHKFNLSETFLVGNYPFNGDKSNSDGTRASQLYAEFVEALHPKVAGSAVVMPSYWAHKNSKVKKIFTETGCEKIGYCKFDNVSIDTAYVISSRTKRDNEVIVLPKSGNQYKVNLESDTKIFLNADKEFVNIFNKKLYSENTLGDIWKRSPINRNNKSLHTGSTPIIEVPSIEKPIYTNLDKSIFPGFDNWKVMINNVLGDKSTLGNPRIEGPGVGSTYSVVNLVVNSEDEAYNLKNYLETKIAKIIVQKTKANGANSKILLSNIPMIDLTKKVSDEDLYNHFGLTQEEREYIEANVK
jgi:hypothetical protein